MQLPLPLTLALLALGGTLTSVSATAGCIVAGIGALLEFWRFWLSGSSPAPTQTGLVRSGETPADEEARSTLLRG